MRLRPRYVCAHHETGAHTRKRHYVWTGSTTELKGERLEREKPVYFIDRTVAPRMMQMEGLETTILSGLHGEKMMMVLNATLPGHTVPLHSHPQEQVGMVYAGKAKLRIGDEERIVQKRDFYCIPANVPHSDTCLGDEPFVMLDIFYPIREDFIERLKKST